MRSLKLLILVGVCALVNCQDCSVRGADNPLDGINTKETDTYPDGEINRALAADPRTADVIAAAAKETEIQSKLEFIAPATKASSLCKSTLYQRFPIEWTYVNTSGLKCWILQNWWTFPLSYVDCPEQYCQNLPCSSDGHYCVPTKYTVYTVWSWCFEGGFQIYSFKLPQCCECQKFC